MLAVPAASAIPRPRNRWRHTALAVFLLLAYYAAMSLSASLRKGPSFDEGEHLLTGYVNWVYGDFRMEAGNGDLTKRWATLPFLVTRPNFPDTNMRFWRDGDAYPMAFLLFFRQGNEPEWMLLQARMMMLLLGVATGLVMFWCARELFGDFGGLVSLSLFVFSPNMLAFGAHVGTAMPVCLFMLGSTWCIWRLLHRVTWGWLLASVMCLGLLFLAKPSGLVIVPVMAVLVAVKLALGRPLVLALGRKEKIIASRARQLGVVCALIAVHAAGSWAIIWANYDFRYTASSDPADTRLVFKDRPVEDEIGGSAEWALAAAQRTHFLPEGFLEGLRLLLTTDERRQTFLNGEWRIGGWRHFFPFALMVKSSPALLLLVTLGLASWLWVRDRRITPSAEADAPCAPGEPPSYGAIAYAVLLVVYFLVASWQDVNIGHRHLLPAYPPLYILAGAIALAWPFWRKWARALAVLLMLWRAGESIIQYPHYLAYFSPFVGGSSQGYKHLVDSSLDWGMDLPALKNWLDRNNPGRGDTVYLAYFGTDSPRYQEIVSRRLPGFPDWLQRRAFPLSEGIYAISATLFQSLYTPTFGPWNPEFEQLYQASLYNMTLFQGTAGDPARRAELLRIRPAAFWEEEYSKFEKLRFGRLCAWLRLNRPPDDSAGYSILIWRLNHDEVRDALFGPAPLEAPEALRVIADDKPAGMSDAE